MVPFVYVEIDRAKLGIKPFEGEIETDCGHTISWQERPDIGPDALKLTCDSLKLEYIVERPFQPIPPWHEWRETGMEV